MWWIGGCMPILLVRGNFFATTVHRFPDPTFAAAILQRVIIGHRSLKVDRVQASGKAEDAPA